jgi:hypothetical protein
VNRFVMGLGWAWNKEGVSRRDAEFAEEDRRGCLPRRARRLCVNRCVMGLGWAWNREGVSRRDAEFAEEAGKGCVPRRARRLCVNLFVMGLGWAWNTEGVSRRDAEFAEEDRKMLLTSASSASLREPVRDEFGLGMEQGRRFTPRHRVRRGRQERGVCLGVLGASA